MPHPSWREWLRSSNLTIHGHPDTFDFDWERMDAEELPLPKVCTLIIFQRWHGRTRTVLKSIHRPEYCWYQFNYLVFMTGVGLHTCPISPWYIYRITIRVAARSFSFD